MKRSPSASLPRLIVRAASIGVPSGRRAEWRAEWQAELWHLSRARGLRPFPVLCFSLGAVQDAFWICRDHVRSRAVAGFRAGSAGRCCAFLCLWLAAGLLLCLCLPGARKVFLPLPYGHAADLVVISSAGNGAESASIPLDDYQEWTSDAGKLFSQIAFYRPETKSIYLAGHRKARIPIALASGNLIRMLELPEIHNRAEQGNASSIPRLYLSRGAWRAFYHSDRRIIGRDADIDGARVLIAGVLPDDSWRLPGAAGAVLLASDGGLSALPPHAKGFVLARIRDSAFPPPRDGWRSMVESRDGLTYHFDCISLEQPISQPRAVFLFALLLACLALPATTALPLGDYPLRRGRLPCIANLRRWIFLAAKFAFLVPIVWLCSTALAYGLHPFASAVALYIQIATAFPALLLGFRWILQDQRRRCPVCLRRLSNPARVGQASCNFLAWNGTELICGSGHGLLHIPELPTSWCSSQRWLALDSSWLCLFRDSYAAPTGMI